jgi:hypothetical protein
MRTNVSEKPAALMFKLNCVLYSDDWFNKLVSNFIINQNHRISFIYGIILTSGLHISFDKWDDEYVEPKFWTVPFMRREWRIHDTRPEKTQVWKSKLNLSIRIRSDSRLNFIGTLHILFSSEIFNIFFHIYLLYYILVSPTKILCAFLFPIRSTCPRRHILLNCNSLLALDKEHCSLIFFVELSLLLSVIQTFTAVHYSHNPSVSFTL